MPRHGRAAIVTHVGKGLGAIPDVMGFQKIAGWIRFALERAPWTKNSEHTVEPAIKDHGLSDPDRERLRHALRMPWPELIGSIRCCDPKSRFALLLLNAAYDKWHEDPSIDSGEFDECRVRLAQAVAAAGNDRESLELLRLAAADRENGIVVKGEPLSLILLRIAEGEARCNRLTIAIDTVRRAIALQPGRHFFYKDRARAYSLLGELLGQTGDDAEAKMAKGMARAWTRLDSAAGYIMRDDPEGGLKDARAARKAMRSAGGSTHGDLEFAERGIASASPSRWTEL